MNKIVLIIVNCIFLSSLNYAGLHFSYIGSFAYPEKCVQKKIPFIPLYYKGESVLLENNTYFFVDQEKFTEMTFVISLLDKPKTNTIVSFFVPEKQKYLLVKIKRKTKQFALKKGEVFQETWLIEQKEGSGPFKIPTDAFIILLNPTCIESIKTVTWKRDSFVIQLPVIILKKDIENLSDYTNSLFSHLDVKLFHQESNIISQQQNKKSKSSRKIIV